MELDPVTLNEKIRALIREITNMPKDKQLKLKPLVKQKEAKETAEEIDKSLADLRICLKYILFDLEATKRERDKLKRMMLKDDEDDEPNRAEGSM